MMKHRATPFGSGQFHGDARGGAAHAPAGAPPSPGRRASAGADPRSSRGELRPLAGSADASDRHASAPVAGGGVLVGLATAAVSAVAPAAGRALGSVLRRSGGTFAAASFLGLVQLGLAVAAIIDIARRDESQLNGPKALWYGAQTINWIGPIVYFLGGRKLER